MFSDAMSTGMHSWPELSKSKKGTANGNSTPDVDVLKTLKFVGFWSMEIKTAGYKLR